MNIIENLLLLIVTSLASGLAFYGLSDYLDYKIARCDLLSFILTNFTGIVGILLVVAAGFLTGALVTLTISDIFCLGIKPAQLSCLICSGILGACLAYFFTRTMISLVKN